MKFHRIAAPLGFGLTLLAAATGASAQSFTQGFDGVVVPAGWTTKNLSTSASTGNPWTVGTGIVDSLGNVIVGPYDGDSFAVVNYSSIGSGSGTINNWFISPVITGIKNGDTFSFYTTTTPSSAYPDRLELRLAQLDSVNVGTTTTSVGDFSKLLLSVNPTLATGGYPEDWTLETVTVSGLTGPVTGRVAFRYFVTAGGPSGANSNIIGVDDFSYTSVVTSVPEVGTWAMFAAGLVGVAALRRRSTAV